MAAVADKNSDQPWLLCRQTLHADAEDSALNFLSLSADPRRRRRLAVDLPSPTFSFLGSGHGWLLLYDSARCSPSLLHPVTGRLLPLPSFLLLPHLRRRPGDVITIDCPRCRYVALGHNPTTNSASLPSDLIHRSILTVPDPTRPDDVTVFLILRHPHHFLLFASPQSRAWTQLDDALLVDALIPHRGKFMAIQNCGIVSTWELRNILQSPKLGYAFPVSVAREMDEDPSEKPWMDRDLSFFLVSSPDGEAVWRVKRERKDGEVEVKVHEVEDSFMMELESLDGCAVFVGGGMWGFSVRAEEHQGLREDCVCFAEDRRDGEKVRIAVYCLGTKRMEVVEVDAGVGVCRQPAWVLLSGSAGEVEEEECGAHVADE